MIPSLYDMDSSWGPSEDEIFEAKMAMKTGQWEDKVETEEEEQVEKEQEQGFENEDVLEELEAVLSHEVYSAESGLDEVFSADFLKLPSFSTAASFFPATLNTPIFTHIHSTLRSSSYSPTKRVRSLVDE